MAILEALSDPIIRQAGQIFAEEFRKQGIFGGGSGSSGSKGGRGGGSSRTEQADRAELGYLQKIKSERDKSLKQARKLRKAADTLEKKHKANARNIEWVSMARKKASADESKARVKYKKQTESLSARMARFGDTVSSIGKKLKDLAWKHKESIALITTAGVKAVNDFQTQLATNAISTGNIYDSTVRALKLGVDPELLSNLQAQNRETIIAVGGITNWSKQLIEGRKTFFKYTGNNADAARLLTESFQTLRIAGITPTLDQFQNAEGELTDHGKTLRDISIMSGKSSSQVNSLMRTYVESENVRMRLASTSDEKTKRRMMREIATREKLLNQLGYMGDQATRVGQRMDEMAGEGPRDRIRAAAKLRMYMGTIGMGAEGARAQRIRIQGENASPEDKKWLMKTMAKIQNRSMADRFSPNINKQLVSVALYQKAGLEKDKVFMKITNKDIDKKSKEFLNNKKTVGEQHSTVSGILSESLRVLTAIKDNPLMLIMSGILTSIAGTVKIIAIRMLFGKGIFGKMGRGGKGLLGKLLLGGAAGKGKSLFGKLLLGGKGMAKTSAILAPILATAQAAYQLWGESFEESAKHAGEIFGKAGKNIWNDMANRIISAFRHIGKNLLDPILSIFETSTTKIGGDIGIALFNVLQNGKLWEKLILAMPGGHLVLKMLSKRITERTKFGVGRPTAATSQMVGGARLGMWGREVAARHGGKLSEAQQGLNRGFQDIVAKGGTLYGKDQKNSQLNDIKVLLEKLGTSSDKTVGFGKEQFAVLADIAKNGKIDTDERRVWEKTMKTFIEKKIRA